MRLNYFYISILTKDQTLIRTLINKPINRRDNVLIVKKINTLLKKSSFFNTINSKIKAYITKKKYYDIKKYYYRMPQLISLKQLLLEKGFTLEWHSKFMKDKPNILFIGTDEYQDNSGFIQALMKYSNVIPFTQKNGEWGHMRSGNCKVENGNRLVEILKNLRRKGTIPNLVIMQSWGFAFDVSTLNDLKKQYSFKLINIGMDERFVYHMKTPKGSQENGISGLIPAMDLALVTTPEIVDWYLKEGVPAVYFPLASSPEFYFPLNIKKIYDVGFIGKKYGIREKVVNKLLNSGINAKAHGPGWHDGKLPLEKNNEFFNQCKIVLGIGTIGYCTDFFNPKLRDFDAPMSGSLYITNRTPELKELFDEGENIELFDTLDELVEKVKFYLNNENARLDIEKKALKHSMDNHTYEKRIQTLFENLSDELLNKDIFIS
jgi:spore maturation protein CgeB